MPFPFQRIAVLVLDSLGVGALPDAAAFGDAGADTLGHTVEAAAPRLPHLCGLGLGRVGRVEGEFRSGGYGRMAERSAGKDTITGHWEMMGQITARPFPTYPEGFPPDVVDRFAAICGHAPLGNEVASGTEIILRLGDLHRATGRPILYTSADSVFQVAAHEDVVPPETLYDWCRRARAMLTPPHQVARVIARPFAGTSGSYARTPRRHDFSLPPPGETRLDQLRAAGVEVVGIGKIPDIFAHRGFSREVPAAGDQDGLERTVEALRSLERGLVFTNLVELDSSYGHRRDPEGYARHLELLDSGIPRVQEALGADGLLLVSADHGNDPTHPGTDHTREWVPLLLWHPGIGDVPLGDRPTLADLGATVAAGLGLPPETLPGASVYSGGGGSG